MLRIVRRLCLLCLVLFLCQCRPGVPWKLMRTIDPYRKKQDPEPYSHQIQVTGIRLQILKFYYTPELACVYLQADNQQGYANAYINPYKTQLVCDQLGLWALKSTAAAREPMFQRIAQNAFPQPAPTTNVRWSQRYFPHGTIPLREKRDGLICFQLKIGEQESDSVQIKHRCRIRLTDVRVAEGSVQADWIWLEKL